MFLVQEFARCLRLLWRDKLGQISLATTTLFWGAGATLQFIVLKWAETALGYSLSQATVLQGICAVGIAIGAVVAARFVPLNRAVNVVPVGIAMGLIVIAMIFARNVAVAIPLMVLIGALAGFFVVPMNALLQHRGHILMGAGHSIAVQNFNENLSILIMLGVYALLVSLQSLDLHRDRALRRVRRHHHGAGAPAPSEQRARGPAAEHSVGRAPLAGRRDGMGDG